MATKAAARDQSPGESAQRAKPARPPRNKRRIEDRLAAANLGAVYKKLAIAKALPLDDWANPTGKTWKTATLQGPIETALKDVYGSDIQLAAKTAGKPWRDTYSYYKEDFDTVMPRIKEAAFRLTPRALTEEERVLRKLHTSLLSDTALNDRLHRNALSVKAEEPWLLESPSIRPDPDIPWQEDADKHRKRELLVPIVAKQNDKILSTLFIHPSGVEIVRAYSEGSDGTAGTKVAVGFVEDAVDALRSFRDELANTPYHIWRYPPFVWLGVRELGLGDIRGFKQYTAAIGQVLGRNPYQKYFSFAGQALALLAMVFSGPTGVPLAVAAFASGGLLVAGTELGFAYLHDRERDLGVKASVRRKEGQKFVTSATYLDTALAGAAALLAAIGYFGAWKEFGALTKAGHPETLVEPTQVPRPATSPSAAATATTTDAQGLTAGARATGPETKAVPIRTEQPPRPAGTTAETRPAPTPQETAAPPRNEPSAPEAKGKRATGEPVEPSSRKSGPGERPAAAKAPAERAVLDSSAAVEKKAAADFETLLAHNPDLEIVRARIDHLIDDLALLPENRDLVKALRVARRALEDPKRIARVIAKIHAEAQRLTGIPPTAQEQALGLVDAQSRAVARLAGLSPETASQFKAIPKGTPDLTTPEFFNRFASKYYVVDWQIGNEAGHGVMTHPVQDLVIADAFAEAGIPLDGRTFRMKLGSARGGSGNVYMLGKDRLEIGNKVFVELYDSSSTEFETHVLNTPHRPETFYEYLKKSLPDLQ